MNYRPTSLRKLALAGCIFSLLLVSCQCHRDFCGSGRYRCSHFFDTSPNIHPIKYEGLNEAILFENGDLVRYDEDFRSQVKYSLSTICEVDSVRDVKFYNSLLTVINYSGQAPPHATPPSPEEYFNVVIAPDRYFKLDTGFRVIGEFGNQGSPGQVLVNATSAAFDMQGNCYIADPGDSSLKIYDPNGRYLRRLENLGRPIHVKLFDDVIFVLDHRWGRVCRFSMAGDFLGELPGLWGFQDVIAFGFTYKDVIWVVDHGGTRIGEVEFSGDVQEIKTDYCHNDVGYSFQRVTDFDGIFNTFTIVDADANRVIAFSTGPTD